LIKKAHEDILDNRKKSQQMLSLCHHQYFAWKLQCTYYWFYLCIQSNPLNCFFFSYPNAILTLSEFEPETCQYKTQILNPMSLGTIFFIGS
jgi:hypothetical protein